MTTTMNSEELKDFLEHKYRLYNQTSFIETDPIQIPHRFSKKADIEIAAFLASTIAWGQRKSIIANASKLLNLMDNDPYHFVTGFDKPNEKHLKQFVHRTFNGDDLIIFLHALKRVYLEYGSLEMAFLKGFNAGGIKQAIIGFREGFFIENPTVHALKHISNPVKGAAAKRLNMFIRWMVRKDEFGVDFGLWKSIPPSELMCPLDVHSGRVARALGILGRKQDDWLAVEQLTGSLRQLDASDPVKYDFALFGLGVFEKFPLSDD